MAIAVDPLTYVISVPKADLTLVQMSPTEIYDLDLNVFRLWLKDWEDDPEGIVQLVTHVHNTEVSLGGLTYARVIEILDPYSITFEDAQYAVNLVGANSNVGDKVNVNQVSVRSQNSAGLISSPLIEFASFEGGVWVDETSAAYGTVFPNGTRLQPVSNIADARLIATFRGFSTLFILGNYTFGAGDDIEGFQIIGENASRTTLIINPASLTSGCEISEAYVTGTLDNGTIIRNCMIQDLDYVDGVVFSSMLQPGIITLGNNSTAHFLDCYSGVPGEGTPTIDMGGSGQPLAFRNYNGGIKLINKTGPESVSIDMNSGQIILDSTVTNGTIVLRGIGKLTDESAGATVLADDLLNGEIKAAVEDGTDEVLAAIIDSTNELSTIIESGDSKTQSLMGSSNLDLIMALKRLATVTANNRYKK